MAMATYRITEKKCATCRWWTGQRTVEFRANKPFYVKVEADACYRKVMDRQLAGRKWPKGVETGGCGSPT